LKKKKEAKQKPENPNQAHEREGSTEVDILMDAGVISSETKLISVAKLGVFGSKPS
jgi:hypothetical protein